MRYSFAAALFIALTAPQLSDLNDLLLNVSLQWQVPTDHDSKHADTAGNYNVAEESTHWRFCFRRALFYLQDALPVQIDALLENV